MDNRRPLIAGNWKMNLRVDESISLVNNIAENIRDIEGVDVLIAPPFTSLSAVRHAIDNQTGILLSGQNMYWEPNGAYTGEISGSMLVEAGCTHVILGHSERRAYFKETNEMIDLKAKAAILTGLIPIICIGESLSDREEGRTFEVLKGQLDGSLKHFFKDRNISDSLILAYEPVWAIGTGKTATPDQAQEVHQYIRKWVAEKFNQSAADIIKILYGGSVKPDNIKELMSRPDIDGALVGGASLKPSLFVPIIRFAEK